MTKRESEWEKNSVSLRITFGERERYIMLGEKTQVVYCL